MASTDKDLDLKLKVSAVLRKIGYTVFQEVDLCTYSYQPRYNRKQVTDFDVVGIQIESDFGAHIAVAECKSATEEAMKNLLKLKGVKDFFEADKAYFVQKRIDINAREIGRELGIWVLDDGNLATLMAGVGIREDPHVEMEREVYLAKEETKSQQKRDLAKLVDYLRYDFWTLPDHRNIVNLVRLAEQARHHLKPSDKAHIVWAHQLATNFGLAAVRFTGQIVRHNIDDLQEGVLTRILGGPRERRDREATFDKLARFVPNSGLSLVPSFHKALAELVARFVNASLPAAGVVSCLDHLTRFLLVPKIDDVYGRSTEVYGARTVKLARDVLRFLIKETGLAKEIFESSLNEKTGEGTSEERA